MASCQRSSDHWLQRHPHRQRHHDGDRRDEDQGVMVRHAPHDVPACTSIACRRICSTSAAGRQPRQPQCQMPSASLASHSQMFLRRAHAAIAATSTRLCQHRAHNSASSASPFEPSRGSAGRHRLDHVSVAVGRQRAPSSQRSRSLHRHHLLEGLLLHVLERVPLHSCEAEIRRHRVITRAIEHAHPRQRQRGTRRIESARQRHHDATPSPSLAHELMWSSAATYVVLNMAWPTARQKDEMTSVEQCRASAAEYKKLGDDPNNSARRSTVLKSISHSWTALGHQLESLALIDKSEKGK